MPILEDLTKPGLPLIIYGMAVGDRSAAERAYYAHPGNRFWKVIHATGLTRLLIAPKDWRSLINFGIGLTDLARAATAQTPHCRRAPSIPLIYERKSRNCSRELWHLMD